MSMLQYFAVGCIILGLWIISIVLLPYTLLQKFLKRNKKRYYMKVSSKDPSTGYIQYMNISLDKSQLRKLKAFAKGRDIRVD